MPASIRIYLDCCSYNRLDDDPSQPRIAKEADAVKQILAAVDAGTIELVGSDVLDLEFAQTKDEARRLRLQELRKSARTVIMLEQESSRARELEGLGFTVWMCFI